MPTTNNKSNETLAREKILCRQLITKCSAVKVLLGCRKKYIVCDKSFQIWRTELQACMAGCTTFLEAMTKKL
jgi:hypothetical protein